MSNTVEHPEPSWIKEARKYIGLKEVKGRTVFIISHRVSVLKITNKIVSLYDGKIIELGTKEDLFKNTKGYFYNLCKAQNILSEI